MNSKKLYEIIQTKKLNSTFNDSAALMLNDLIEINTITGWRNLALNFDQYDNLLWFIGLIEEPFEISKLRLKQEEPSCDGEIVEIKGKKYELKEVK